MMAGFLSPILRAVVPTILFLVLIDMGFAAIRYVPAIRAKAPGSIVTYLDYGRSIEAKSRQRATRPGAERSYNNWLPPGTAALIDNPPALGPVPRSSEKPCMTFYGMSFANYIMRSIEDNHPSAVSGVRQVSAPAAPPNWTWAAYYADRVTPDARACNDVAVWTILASEIAATGSPTMQTHSFDAPFLYTMPQIKAVEGELAIVWPPMPDVATFEAALADPVQAAAWRRSLAETDPFYDRFAFDANWLDRSTLVGFIRRGVSVGRLRDRRAAVADDDAAMDASGLSTTLALMADRFAEQVRQDGGQPVILVIQTRGDRAEPARVLCVGQAAMPVFATTAVADQNDLKAYASDGHFTQAVTDEIAAALVGTLEEWAKDGVACVR